MSAHARSRIATALVAAFALLFAAGVFLTGERALAALQDVAETGERGWLSLRADPVPFTWQDAQPGDEAYWLIEASLADAAVGSLRLEMRADGPLVTELGMAVSVDACSEPYDGEGGTGEVPLCPGTTTPIVQPTALNSIADGEAGTLFPLADLYADDPRHLRVTLRIPSDASPEAIGNSTATFAVGMHAAGDSPHSPAHPEDDLAQTGADVVALVILAVGLVGLGASVSWLRRARRDSRFEVDA